MSTKQMIVVPVRFSGEVTVEVPASIPEGRAMTLAKFAALFDSATGEADVEESSVNDLILRYAKVAEITELQARSDWTDARIVETVGNWAIKGEARIGGNRTTEEYRRFVVERQMQQRRYTAHFQPEAWLNHQAIQVDPEGPISWDVTSFLLGGIDVCLMDIWEEIRLSGRWIDIDDDLKHDPNAPAWIREWSGPFTISVTEEKEPVVTEVQDE